MPFARPSAARVALVVLGALLLGLVAVPAPAHADGTRQYRVLNLTSKTLKLTAIDRVAGWQPNNELPPIGTVLLPGDEPAFEMDNKTANNAVVLRFVALDTAQQNVGNVAFRLDLSDWGIRWSRVESSGGSVEGATTGWQYLRAYDKKGSTPDTSRWSPADQARVAGGLCRHPDVSCRSVITTYPNAPEKIFADKAQQSEYESNNGCSNLVHMFGIERSLTVTHSWEVAVAYSSGIKDIWSAELTAKYGGSVVDSTKVTDSVTRTLLPGERGWVVWRIPVLRYRGDWTVTTPTTTLAFTNLPVDTGDPERTRPESDYRSDAISPTGKITKPSQCP